MKKMRAALLYKLLSTGITEGYSMKTKAFTFVFLFCLLVVSCPFSGYATGPDGFASVPWGASKSQVDRAMAQQGFSSEGEVTHHYEINDGRRVFSYDGTLAGADGHATFWFLNDTFYRGEFGFHHEDGVGSREERAYGQFSAVIQSKYGSPTQSNPASGGLISRWQGLQAPGSSDTVEIVLFYYPSSSRCGRGFCSSMFGVHYFNESLHQRLLAAGVNGRGL